MANTELRTLSRDDVDAAVQVVVDAGMFSSRETGVVEELLAAFLDSNDTQAFCQVAIDGSQGVVGVAYGEPRPAAERLWELTMIGVRPTAQRNGVGRLLLQAVEGHVGALDARKLVVQTSDTAESTGARAFYERQGYEMVAHVPDWWADGDGLVLFERRIAPRADR